MIQYYNSPRRCIVLILSRMFSIVLGESAGKNRSWIFRQVVPYLSNPSRTHSVSSGDQKFFLRLIRGRIWPIEYLTTALPWFVEEDIEVFWTGRSISRFSFSCLFLGVEAPRRLMLGPIESSESSSTPTGAGSFFRYWKSDNFIFFRLGVELFGSSNARLTRPFGSWVEVLRLFDGPGAGESDVRLSVTVELSAATFIGLNDGTLSMVSRKLFGNY